MSASTQGFHPFRLSSISAASLLAAIVVLPLGAQPLEPPAEAPSAEVVRPEPQSPPEPADALADYRALAADRARGYDQTRDISPQQLLILLEVSERTGANLGQALATGEYESARTWNDFVRPTLNNGSLGSATGVWQFIPSTFHRIIARFGKQILAASDADADSGRPHLDLGSGPFDDADVRRMIQEAVDGKRGTEDEALQLLRHNFAVLAFAKHYLSLESGAETAEEDYLFHFLGAERGRQVLALARGPARDTLCVKQPELPRPVAEPQSDLLAGDNLDARRRARAVLQSASVVSEDFATLPEAEPALVPRITARRGLSSGLQQRGLDIRIAGQEYPAVYESSRPMLSDSAVWTPAPAIAASVSSEWGYPADSPVVTGNLGMFYRDGRGQSQPYTWGEFMDKLASRVRAKDQPAMVRAKYGVGFEVVGGDMPEWRYEPESKVPPLSFTHAISRVLVPGQLITGPLGEGEAQRFKARLTQLIRDGEDRPLASLPPTALAALRHLGALEGDETQSTSIEQALARFRRLVGKAPPDDPSHAAMLLPVERAALELYEQRLARYAALQAAQRVALEDAVDLGGIRRMPAGPKRWSKPHVALLQRGLSERGLLQQPTKQVVWRDKKRKRHVSYEPAPFDGLFGPITLGALHGFQRRNGLLETEGRLDGVTLGMLGLPPMGQRMLFPLAGPSCPLDGPASDQAASCPRPFPRPAEALRRLAPNASAKLPRWQESVQAAAEPTST